MTKGLHVKSPETAQEWHAYYQLRWQVLRAPWQQPLGSEQDDLEAQSVHLMLVADNGEIAAVGRLHALDKQTGQIRYMAVAAAWQGQGAGAQLLQALEHQACQLGMQSLYLNARESALSFYLKQGYQVIGSAPTQFGIAHHRMQKVLVLAGNAERWAHWCKTLQHTWHSTIPLSDYMQLNIDSFNGYQLQCSAPLAPNINLHQTMFAGSIYTLATLTGWGMLYLQLQSLGLSGKQVLADASIRYLKPIHATPYALCHLHQVRGDLSLLAQQRTVKQQIKVGIYTNGVLCAEFSGRYAVLPE